MKCNTSRFVELKIKTTVIKHALLLNIRQDISKKYHCKSKIKEVASYSICIMIRKKEVIRHKLAKRDINLIRLGK